MPYSICMDNNTANIDTLVRKHTAFRTYSELATAMRDDGYIPTIPKKSEELAVALESRGWRVWRSRR